LIFFFASVFESKRSKHRDSRRLSGIQPEETVGKSNAESDVFQGLEDIEKGGFLEKVGRMKRSVRDPIFVLSNMES
jgi:hypothetical protein